MRLGTLRRTRKYWKAGYVVLMRDRNNESENANVRRRCWQKRDSKSLTKLLITLPFKEARAKFDIIQCNRDTVYGLINTCLIWILDTSNAIHINPTPQKRTPTMQHPNSNSIFQFTPQPQKEKC
jgi:hypothetical protein